MSDTAPYMPGDAFEALPDALSEVIRCVVRKTRLWPSEKRDVQAELESHFREGLIELTGQGMSVGESVEALRDGFGDPELTAKLIRRGKKRGRSMLWKIVMGAALTGLGGVGAGAAYVGYLWLAEPHPTVDYVAKINEPVKQIAEADRGWPIMRNAILQMTVNSDVDQVRTTMPLPGEVTWPEAMTWVTQNQRLIPTFIEAANKPAYGFIYDNKATAEFLAQRALARGEPTTQHAEDDPLAPPTLSLLLPHLADYRDVGRLLVLAGRNQFYHGDFAAGWTALDAVHRLGAQLLTGQTLIEQLVGRAMMAMAGQEMRRILYDMRDSVTPEQLAIVGTSQPMTMSLDGMKPNYEGEKLFFYDVIQYVFTDDGDGNGRLIPSQFEKIEWMGQDEQEVSKQSSFHREGRYLHIAAAHADRVTTVDKYLELWGKMQERLQLPLFDPRRAEAGQIMDAALRGQPLGRFQLIKTLLPNLSYADASLREGVMELQALRTIVAILNFKQNRGSLPTRLGELVPVFLTEVPTDAYSGSELRYDAGAAHGPKLYSVGRNLADDSASTEVVESSPGGRPTPRDLVFWPEDRLK